jgi:hypothetical protein
MLTGGYGVYYQHNPDQDPAPGDFGLHSFIIDCVLAATVSGL